MDHDTRVAMLLDVLRNLMPDEVINSRTLCTRARIKYSTFVHRVMCDHRLRIFRAGNNKWGLPLKNGLDERVKLAELAFLRRERNDLCNALGITVDDIPRFLRECQSGLGLSYQRTQRSHIPSEVDHQRGTDQLGHNSHHDQHNGAGGCS